MRRLVLNLTIKIVIKFKCMTPVRAGSLIIRMVAIGIFQVVALFEWDNKKSKP
jgi:hypothetical protein